MAAASTPQSSSSGPSLGRRAYEKGLQTFTWKASDDNNDDLTYDVLYRRESQTSWSVLRRGLTDEILVWDTSLVPDGNYILRVVASDSPSNPPGSALKGELESSVFTIDNTPPRLTVDAVQQQADGRLVVDFTATDAVSIIERADYALDGRSWQALYPRDGIADSRTEQDPHRAAGEPPRHDDRRAGARHDEQRRVDVRPARAAAPTRPEARPETRPGPLNGRPPAAAAGATFVVLSSCCPDCVRM